jgi:hypothetical protein
MAPDPRFDLLKAVSIGPVGTAFDDTKGVKNGEKECVVLYETGVEGGFCVVCQQNCS